ncbi:hypothetical protein ACULTK_003761 [Yersinia enterocolitica]|uniref:hypothetical protein n=1 Tax=Yersinia TaxID=629 RepID=UPI0005DC0C4A|nr:MULTISPECIES: hypothetical protein [Yersinia]EKN3396288.1 hypothetical protein [Yersinia enterocolitica]EKN3469736.1 hypothetical protein [Yersinia enterocolitica]EKN3567256.1 hypothetical protein [Yersinia enterocolitica]EKN3781577.1 hypothetical protein [Yersinia enterocolitica]EKN3833442.1 hypothetical protein [Yersinia enterocolitica]
MKKLKFYLSHILFFFFGVMVTVVLLWVLYKDPTRITAPALAALTAMCTFLLALWSAFKVNKWLNSKVNEKAFKRTEEFLDEMIHYNLSIAKIYYICDLLRKAKFEEFNDDIHLNKELNEYINEYFNVSLSIKVYENTFKHWGINLICRNHFNAIEKKMDSIAPRIRRIIILSSNITNSKHKKEDFLIIQLRSKEVMSYIDSSSFLLDSFTKLTYDQIFNHDKKPTPLSKKV